MRQIPRNMQKQYCVIDESSDEPFWKSYDSVEDAVSDNGDGTEVWVTEPRFLGKFKRKVEMVKIKRRRRKS